MRQARLKGSRKKKVTFHRDRLVAALNKYWRPLPVDEYLHKMGIPETENAIAVSGMPESVADWIWEPVLNEGFNITKKTRVY